MQETSQFQLLRERRFGPFFGVQFLGAFNDNVFKQALFVLPFFLFPATSGQLAGKYEKSRLITVMVAISAAGIALSRAIPLAPAATEALRARVAELRGDWK